MEQKAFKIFTDSDFPRRTIKALIDRLYHACAKDLHRIQKMDGGGERTIDLHGRFCQLIRARNITKRVGEAGKILDFFFPRTKLIFEMIVDQFLRDALHHQFDLRFIRGRKIRRNAELLEIRSDQIQTKAVNRANMRRRNTQTLFVNVFIRRIICQLFRKCIRNAGNELRGGGFCKRHDKDAGKITFSVRVTNTLYDPACQNGSLTRPRRRGYCNRFSSGMDSITLCGCPIYLSDLHRPLILQTSFLQYIVP